ncbi:serine/threonine-protein kinase [Streptomyces sp. WMMC1477]|uniref:serine/threonine-protein kinase n=1 Tax=Streptomyces sp. WMMC1477 TaxID=3015155 RepID=UPI0022B69112|nr:serine/threonine protein kinase [Streptomyces sp. WMMC1477]MCZ7432509.1 protein kinase [Streptomyces sp. WMMC1477]
MGEVFAGRYELVDPIGRGGAGAVWRAWDHRRKRYVAAKVLQQSDAHSLLRFVREQALRIDHPHVLAPTSWAADDDKVMFAMDLVRGGSLAHLIGDYGALPPRLVCVLLDQLLAALVAVHAEDVVHRDIKPANILLDATGRGRPHLRLSDFGISMRKGEPRLTETAYVVGTPGYFAPEQMLGAEPDFPADLYAVGLLGLYLLTGRKPDSRALVEAYEHGVPPAPDGVPEPLWQVLGGLLQPDPHARFRTATGVRKALTGALELLDDGATVALGAAEAVEVFDQLGPLPQGYGPDGPLGAGHGGPARGTAAAPADGFSAAAAASATGSFHLAPPGPTPEITPATAPPGPGGQAGQVGPVSAGVPTEAGTPGPTPLQPMPGAQAPGGYGAGATPTAVPAPTAPVAPARRAGPAAAVAVPVIALALLCYAVGVWALTQS